MAHKRQRIVLSEGDIPLITVRLRKRLPTGASSPYLLTASPAVKFIVKATEDTADSAKDFEHATSGGGGDGNVTITDTGADPGDSYSEITVQFAASDVASAGRRFYKIVVVKANQTDTVMSGPFIVENV